MTKRDISKMIVAALINEGVVKRSISDEEYDEHVESWMKRSKEDLNEVYEYHYGFSPDDVMILASKLTNQAERNSVFNTIKGGN